MDTFVDVHSDGLDDVLFLLCEFDLLVQLIREGLVFAFDFLLFVIQVLCDLEHSCKLLLQLEQLLLELIDLGFLRLKRLLHLRSPI